MADQEQEFRVIKRSEIPEQCGGFYRGKGKYQRAIEKLKSIKGNGKALFIPSQGTSPLHMMKGVNTTTRNMGLSGKVHARRMDDGIAIWMDD